MPKAPIAALVPALFLASAVLSVPALAADAGVKLAATLDGKNGGDANGSGAFAGTADVAAGKLCYTLGAQTTNPPAMAHIHTGEAGKSGPPVVSLKVTATQDCVDAPADTLKAIVANPAGYYVNVHTSDHPAGAVRGQLAKK